MTGRLDVAGRLAEGLPAVEHTQRYLRACQQVGYRNPDLTGDPEPIHDWYASEEGLDLDALDGDCAALRAAGAVIAEALRLQRDQLNMLTTTWTGPGADAAIAFLGRHCDIAGQVVTEVRAAAQRCESLRDNLWQLVDAKVATTTAIDDRTLAQRRAWLAAAAVVTTEASAREVVEQQVKPYVDNDIRQDWRVAMLSTRAGIRAAYDMVNDRFAAAPRAYFDLPGDFGPLSQPPRRPAAATLSAAPGVFTALPGGPGASEPTPMAATAPMAASAPLPAPASLPEPAPMPAATQPESGTGWAGNPGGAGGLGSGGALGDLGGLGALAGRIVAGMGDLLASSATDPTDDLFDDDPDDRHEPDSREERGEPNKPESASATGEVYRPVAEPIRAPATPPAGPPAAEQPAPAPVADPLPKPKPPRPTPCEIAANELPQAGR